MKCFKCQTDNNLKDRTANQGKCKSCHHPFVFDPKTHKGVDFTDALFANAIAKASANNTLFFTQKQLFYCFEERRAGKPKAQYAIGCALIVFSIIVLIGLVNSPSAFWFIVFLILIGSGIALFTPQVRRRIERLKRKQTKGNVDDFKRWVEQWKKVNGKIAKMLQPPKTPTEPANISEEIKAYSFDRVVVCERDSVAQFLIANNFHFEHNCAVLAIDGYPNNIFHTVMEMLRRNPVLKVYSLHNASPAFVQMTRKLLADPKWFKDWPGVEVYDIGLMPRQVIGRRMFVEQSAGSAEFASHSLAPLSRAALTAEEIKWLEEGNHIELESLRPQTLLRIVTQGIALSRDPRAQDTLAAVDGSDHYGGTYIFVSDSFG